MNQPMKGPMDVAVLGEPIVAAIVPRTFILTMPNGTPVRVPGGIHDMPEAVANHFYSKANGVSIYAAAAVIEVPADEAATIEAAQSEVATEAAIARDDDTKAGSNKRPTLTAKK